MFTFAYNNLKNKQNGQITNFIQIRNLYRGYENN